MLQPLTADELDRALDLLVEGFPERSPAFWQAALDNLRSHAENDAVGHPHAFLMVGKAGPAGVVLTPAVSRTGPDGGRQRVVNLSSWYVRPEQRWRAPLMLKSLLRDDGTVYTDLTPTPAVRQMLPALGFRPINRGTRITVLPVAAVLGRRGARVRPLPVGDEPEFLAGHRALGCRTVMVESPLGSTLVVTRPVRYRGIPAADLVYAESHKLLDAGFSAFARHLIGRGYGLMRSPAVDDLCAAGSVVLPRGFWFARGGSFCDRVDVVGSELTLFNL